jgi:hypothetical protein
LETRDNEKGSYSRTVGMNGKNVHLCSHRGCDMKSSFTDMEGKLFSMRTVAPGKSNCLRRGGRKNKIVLVHSYGGGPEKRNYSRTGRES